ncbi:hypothetical protein [Flyfo microvirus Tbat1_66]|nr:hypothetical protein [Flyfo microvirus Tbat1_66]
MSRRSRRNIRASEPRRRGGSYSPPTPRRQRPSYRLSDPLSYSPTRTQVLDHPVWASRTVRPPLIRTVLRDTPLRKLNNRRSPDVPARALARMKPWTTFETEPFPRAVTCARRTIRREVLFATRQTNGAGSRGVPKSKERCS